MSSSTKKLDKKRVLIAGGYGEIGSHIARHIRNNYPDIELILTGRNPDKGKPLATELGGVELATLDLQKPFNLSDFGHIDLVIASLVDPADALIEQAWEHGINYISMTRLVNELTSLLLHTLQKPSHATVVLADHWQVGIATLIAKNAAAAFSKIDSIEVSALYDEADPIGPMVIEQLDSFHGPALLRKDGKWMWLSGEDNAKILTLFNGEQVNASPLAALDATSLAAITGAKNIRFDFAVGKSIGTQKGEIASHDVYIDIEGTLTSGAPGRTRTLVSGTKGQSSMTGLGAMLMMEGVLGLAGQTSPEKGKIYLPETLLTNPIDLERLKTFGIQTSTEIL